MLFFTGLEYKFIVKSVDPDATTTLTERKNKLEEVAFSLTSNLQKKEKHKARRHRDSLGELSPPVNLAEEKKFPNSTGEDKAMK